MICRRSWASLIAIVAVAVLASTPAWGQGLSDRLVGFAGAHRPGCGCGASQKGGIFQKAGVTQKGGVLQKGGVIQKGKGVLHKGGGCGACQKGGGIVQKSGDCGACQKGGGVAHKGGGGCNSCCLNIIPAVINGVGCLLNGIFTCDRCGSGCSSKGGCHSCGGGKKSGYYPMGPVTSNPFIEDSLTPPPVPMSQARVTLRAPIYSAATRTRSTPQKISVGQASPINTAAAETHVRRPAVIRANNVVDVEDDIPANPLRK